MGNAVKTGRGPEVARVLIRTICTYGCFETSITDEGRQFVNYLNDVLCEKLQIDHKIASAYHPQTNGLQERFNQTLERAISKFVNENHDDWDEHMVGILFAYRTAIHNSTKLSPFYVMYGRHPILPVDMDLGATRDESATGNTATVDTIKDITKQVVDRQHLAYSKVQENIERAQARQKEYYDAKHMSQTNEMRVGQLVLMKNN